MTFDITQLEYTPDQEHLTCYTALGYPLIVLKDNYDDKKVPTDQLAAEIVIGVNAVLDTLADLPPQFTENAQRLIKYGLTRDFDKDEK